MSVWAIVVAAGSGSRFGGPKQYEPLAGQRVLDWSIGAAAKACDGVVLVVPDERRYDPEPGATVVVPGGDTRSASVRCGLAAVPPHADVVVVHDAARPLATAALFTAAVDAVHAGADGAVCAVSVTDTIKRVADGRVAETLDRRRLVSVQTPQAFDAATLRQAHANGEDATDDAALVEAAGGRVIVVAGDPYNFKVTNPDDIVMAAALLERR